MGSAASSLERHGSLSRFLTVQTRGGRRAEAGGAPSPPAPRSQAAVGERAGARCDPSAQESRGGEVLESVKFENELQNGELQPGDWPAGKSRVQAAPELPGDEDRRVRIPPWRRARFAREGRDGAVTPLPRLRPLAGLTEVLPQALFAQEARPGLTRALAPRCQPSRLGGARALVHAARGPEPGRGFVFAGMRGCCVSPWGTRETRAAGRLPPLAATAASGTFSASACGPLPLFCALA